MPGRKEIHVVPSNGSWAVKRENSDDEQTFIRQSDAVDAARAQAQQIDAELIIHGEDGAIRQADSHGNDPFPPKDKT